MKLIKRLKGKLASNWNIVFGKNSNYFQSVGLGIMTFIIFIALIPIVTFFFVGVGLLFLCFGLVGMVVIHVNKEGE